MKPNLGLVCITYGDEVRFKTTTKTRLFKLTHNEQVEFLVNLYNQNLERLKKAFLYCAKNNIRLYRVSSNLFPFSDTDLGLPILLSMESEFNRISQLAKNIRLVMHPDQFVVLNSDEQRVIDNSIVALNNHALVMDLLGKPESSWAAITIHGGKGDRKERLIEQINLLPHSIKSRLVLENDEWTYGAEDILEICKYTKVPMVFDAHHHIVHEKLDNYEHPSLKRIVEESKLTWPDPLWQMVHISNGRESFNDRRHSDLIQSMPSSYKSVPWIEIEAKHKDKAIFYLKNQGW